VLWVLAVVIFVPLLFGVVVAFTNPRLFDEWTRVSYGRLEASFGGKGDAPGQFSDPAGVAVDGAGNVYVLEYGTGRVQRFDGAGKVRDGWSVGQYSQCITADGAGSVYVGTGTEVVKYSGETGQEVERLSFDAPGDYVESLGVSPGGGLVLALAGSSDAVVRLSGALQETGRLQGLVAKQSGSREAVSLAVDGTGQLYVLGKTSNEVFKFNSTGSLLTRFGAGIKGQAYAIAIDAADRVFVSDDKYIQVYNSDGSHLGHITLPDNSGPAHALAFGPQNELYALSIQSGMVYRYAVTSDD
jgi:streptogramin lyase